MNVLMCADVHVLMCINIYLLHFHFLTSSYFLAVFQIRHYSAFLHYRFLSLSTVVSSAFTMADAPKEVTWAPRPLAPSSALDPSPHLGGYITAERINMARILRALTRRLIYLSVVSSWLKKEKKLLCQPPFPRNAFISQWFSSIASGFVAFSLLLASAFYFWWW